MKKKIRLNSIDVKSFTTLTKGEEMLRAGATVPWCSKLCVEPTLQSCDC